MRYPFYLLISHSKLPQRHYIHKASFNIILHHKSFLYLLNLLLSLFLSSHLKCHIINQEIRNRRSYYIRKIRVWFKKKVPASDA